MTKDETLKLALEAFGEINWSNNSQWQSDRAKVAIANLKEALAEQEPVAWAKFSAKGNIIDLLSEPDDDYTPLYTTPPQRTWVGLTDEELSRIEGTHIGRSFAKAIEAKLKEKNG